MLPAAAAHQGNPLQLLRGERGLRDPGAYYEVLQAIAQGRTQFNAIAQATGSSATNALSARLTRLEEFGYIEHCVPVAGNGTRSYALKDPYFRFWFRFVSPNRSRLQGGRVDEVYDDIVRGLDDFMGASFEAACRRWARTYAPKDSVFATAPEIGAYWNRTHSVEVDLVAMAKRRVLALRRLGASRHFRDANARTASGKCRSALWTLSPHASDVDEASDVSIPETPTSPTSSKRSIDGDAFRSRARGGGAEGLRHVEPFTEKHLVRGATTEGGAGDEDVVVMYELGDEAHEGGLAVERVEEEPAVLERRPGGDGGVTGSQEAYGFAEEVLGGPLRRPPRPPRRESSGTPSSELCAKLSKVLFGVEGLCLPAGESLEPSRDCGLPSRTELDGVEAIGKGDNECFPGLTRKREGLVEDLLLGGGRHVPSLLPWGDIRYRRPMRQPRQP